MSRTPDEGLEIAREFSHEGFAVRICLSTTVTGGFAGHVDIHDHGAYKCRIVLAGNLDREAAIAALEEKGKQWIAARGRGDPEGDSRFGVR